MGWHIPLFEASQLEAASVIEASDLLQVVRADHYQIAK